MLRVVAYGDPGTQLAMIYKDIENGTLTKEGEFYKHCKNVKDTLPEVQYDADGNSVNPNEPFPHDESMPAWFTAEQMPEDVQEEFKIGKFAPE